jgi:hypothetical protein
MHISSGLELSLLGELLEIQAQAILRLATRVMAPLLFRFA